MNSLNSWPVFHLIELIRLLEMNIQYGSAYNDKWDKWILIDNSAYRNSWANIQSKSENTVGNKTINAIN